MVNGDRIFGQIMVEDLVYEIRTTEAGDGYLLMKRDFSVLGNEDDTPEESFPIDWNMEKSTAEALVSTKMARTLLGNKCACSVVAPPMAKA